MNSASFLHFHRRESTTLKYYLQVEDEKILDKALSCGLKVNLTESEQKRIEERNLIFDATNFPRIEFKEIQGSSITIVNEN